MSSWESEIGANGYFKTFSAQAHGPSTLEKVLIYPFSPNPMSEINCVGNRITIQKIRDIHRSARYSGGSEVSGLLILLELWHRWISNTK